MRIQHNIMAMNAYRNYNMNNKALSGNLEKLSSGYKINRAGDDAAGLAISEKMRAQITGLNAAQKNVKDGISLVKTAEGAMQEIQDMLNRMDYLATQSANGTYDNEVDRANLQKEVDALKTEINRIADSANFNGIKLLDGSKDPDGASAAVEAAQAALDAAKQPVKVDPAYGDAMSADEIKGMMLTLGGDGPNSANDVGTKTVLETDKVPFQSPSFQVSMNGTSYTMGTDGTADANGVDFDADGLKMTVGGQNFTLTEEDMQAYLVNEKGMDAADVKAGTKLSGEDLAAAIAYKISNDTTNTGVGNGSAPTDVPTGANIKGTFNDGANVWNVRPDGENLVFEFSELNNVPDTALNKYFDTKIEAAVTPTTADVKATGGTFKSTLTVGAVGGTGAVEGSDNTFSVTAKIGDETLTFSVKDQDVDVSATALATAFASATATNADGKTVKLSDYFTATGNGNDLTFTDKTTGAEGSGNTITGLTFTKGAGTTIAADGTTPAFTAVTSAKGEDAYTIGVEGYINAGTEVVIPGVPSESDQLASTSLDFSQLDITDGMKIKLGDEEYTFAVGKDSVVDTSGKNVINMTSVEADKLKATGGDAAERAKALSKLTEVAKDNKTFTVSHEGTGTDSIGLKQKAEAKDTTDMTTMDKFAGYISISQVDVDKTAEAQEKADAAQKDAIAEAEEALKAAQGKEAKALTLQIGDTSDKFNQMEVKIGDMHTSAMGTGKATLNNEEIEVTKTIADISVGDQESAAEAVSVIKNAINYVSSVRGDLGAIQNRLDHTANNLSVMAENIQDAESTIRDTDVAEEMMSYVKNNILVQSAQAMLAQANQVPQGVLQLLG